MLKEDQPQKKTRKKKEFIDFRKLSTKELDILSNKWNQDAFIFECKLQSYMTKSQNPNEEKVERLWNVGAALWRRQNTLERWRINNGK